MNGAPSTRGTQRPTLAEVTDDLARATELLAGKQRILVFTGAGISTESGIPDFRGPQGVWTKLDPEEFTFQRYLSDPANRRRRWQMALQSPLRTARPNPAHFAVVELWEAGVIVGCVTQNIDGLHQAAGLPAEAVVELHGNALRTHCLDCGATWTTGDVLERVAAGDDDPQCLQCGGLLKTSTISFGQAMPEAEMERAYQWADEADAVLAVGSTLSVYPAAWVPLAAARRGVPFLIVNQGSTEADEMADCKWEVSAAEALPALVAALAEGK